MDPRLYDASAIASGFVPGSGLMDFIGQAPAIGGGMGPSFMENIRNKQYLDALLQTAGAAGDALMVVPPVGMTVKAATTAGKTARAGMRAADAARTPDTSYRSTHSSPGPDFGAPLHDLTGGGQMYPSDVYSPKAAQFYGTGYPEADREAFALANRVRGNPDAEVTMYRAVPKNVADINEGDWVSLSKQYAKNHGESVLGKDYKIIGKKVKAKDLYTNADSIHEFGYHPQDMMR